MPFTKYDPADVLLNDLDNYPHAFVLACVMDRQIKAERAWLIPYKLSKKLGDFSMKTLAKLSKEKIFRLMTIPEPLHRFTDNMSTFFRLAIQRIHTRYYDDASTIWSGKPSSAEVVYRLLEFDGIGPKIANMAANILAREIKILFADYYSIDISADVQVRRVFSRLGLCAGNASVEQITYKARSLYPEFPGLMDFPCFEVGRRWFRPNNPLCDDCYMKDLCKTSLGRS